MPEPFYYFDFLSRPETPSQNLVGYSGQISPPSENMFPTIPGNPFYTNTWTGPNYSHVSTSGAYEGTGVYATTDDRTSDWSANPMMNWKRETPEDSVSNYEGSFTVRGYSGANADNELGFSFSSSGGDARFYWHAKTGIIRIFAEVFGGGPTITAIGSVPSPNVGVPNKVSWSYNMSSKQIVMSTSYETISVSAPGFEIRPTILELGGEFTPWPVWFSAMMWANGLIPAPSPWEQELRWVELITQYGVVDQILRVYPRDDELGMNLNGLGRVVVPVGRSNPTSQQRSQRAGRISRSGYQ